MQPVLLALPLTACLFAGCVSVQQAYRPTWPQPETSPPGACPTVTGVYRPRGESADSRWSTNLVIQMFGLVGKWDQVDRIRFSFPDADHLLIQALSKDQLLHTKRLAKSNDDFRCEDGYLVIETKGFVGREGVAGFQDSTVHLAPAGQALAVKETRTEIGALFLVPSGGSITAWTLYPSAQ